MKKFALMLCAVLMAFTLTACGGGGGKDKEVSVDISKLAEELQTTVTSDTLSAVASEMIPSIYFYEAGDVAGAAAYASAGATACEIAVIESADSYKTGDIEKLLKDRVDKQIEYYTDYKSSEVPKLESAIIKSAGAYSVLCVSDDTSKAEEILKSYGF